MSSRRPTQQSSATANRRPQIQYHGNLTSLQAYYAHTGNPNIQITIRKPHPLSTVQTWTLPNMERKTYPKPAPPSIISNSTTKDALKPKTLPNQKIPAKAKLNAPGKIDSKLEDAELLENSRAKVAQLATEILPAIPHIISVPPTPELRIRYSPDESSHPLFTREEVSTLQYMTFIESTDRGILVLEKGWVAEEKGISPASSGGKNSGTPNGETDAKKPEYKKKIKFGDYAKVGRIITTRPNTVTVMEHPSAKPVNIAKGKSTLSTNRSPGSEPGIPAQRNPQIKTTMSAETHSKTHTNSTFPEALKPAPKTSQLNSHTANPTSKPAALSNGTSQKAPNPADANFQKGHLKRSSPDHESAPPVKKVKLLDGALDSKTPIPNGQTAKRPLADDPSNSPATKKQKLSNGVHSKAEHSNHVPQPSQESMSSQESRKKEIPPKNKQQASLESSAKKAAAPKSSNSEQSKSASGSASKSATGKDRPQLPRLLSPTLPDEVISATNSFAEPANPKTSSKKPTNAAATAKPASGKPGMSKTAANSSKHDRIPELLSPGLPPIVEAGLAAREKGKRVVKDVSSSEKPPTTANKTVDTVTDRHEKGRQQNAPGTAKQVEKNSKPRQEANSIPTDAAGPSSAAVQKSLVVPLKYKKRQTKDIERILKLRRDPTKYGHPSGDSSHKDGMEANSRSKAPERPPSRDERRNSQDKSKSTERPVASKFPAPSSVAQKRPRAEEPMPLNNKRLKPSDQAQPSKPSTPNTPGIKQSAPTAPSSAQKSAVNTPRKVDSLKGTAMNRVSSSEGHAHTPQLSQASLPGSAEKPPGTASNLKTEDLPKLAVSLKREFDRLHRTKSGGLVHNDISAADLQLGLVVGLECILTYMAQFDAQDALASKSKDNLAASKSGDNWDGLLKLHGWFDQVIKDMPILEVLSLQVKIIGRFKLACAHAANGFKGSNPEHAAENFLQQKKLWEMLDQKMSSTFVQSVEESTSRSKKGFNPGGNTRHFVATSLRKLKRYADTEGIPWQQQLKISE